MLYAIHPPLRYNDVARKIQIQNGPMNGTITTRKTARDSANASKASYYQSTTPHPSKNRFEPNKNKAHSKRAPRAEVRISLTSSTGEHDYILTKDKIYHATLDELGEIVQGNIYLGNLSDLELDTFPPTRWGNGYKGTVAARPLPNSHTPTYSLQSSRIPL